jgi:hypothetical protein
MRTLFTFLAFMIVITASAQEQKQVLRGKISNGGKGIPGGIITLQGQSQYTLVSDSSGFFEQTIEPGHYTIMVAHENHRSKLLQNVVVMTGKEKVLDIEMEEVQVQLDSVVVQASVKKEAVDVDMWNMQRYAAVFYDPARVVNSHAQLINTDDQANNISVRGTSPNFIQWKLEGVETVNPNHLENAGTINDRPTLNGGGVTMLSAQMLQNSGFEEAPFSPDAGNALTGAFNMKLRDGNNRRYERIIQASLLGTDICLEGPFSKKSSSSFLVNYRYSTVGLLSKLGINFGGEQINYQDLSYLATLPIRNGYVKIFGVTGTSESIFKGTADTALLQTQKDLQNIDYRSFTSINGISFSKSLSNTVSIKHVVAYSVKNVKRNAVPGAISFNNNKETDRYSQQKISSLHQVSKRFSNWSRLKIGTYINYFQTSLRSMRNDLSLTDGQLADPLLQPYISMEGLLIRKLSYRLGMHSIYQMRINDLQILPRLMLTYNITDDNVITFNYGRESQLHPAHLYLAAEQNMDLQPATADAFSLLHEFNWRGFKLKNTLYLQYFDNLPVNSDFGFSAFNYFNEQFNFDLDEKGKARVYGYDITLQKDIRGFYSIASLALFNSSYEMNGRYLEARFNSGYNVALTFGKEFRLRAGNKFLSADVRAVQRNGFRYAGVDLINEQYSYPVHLPDYFRADLRISYRKDKKNSSVIWAIDIQNLSNHPNIANYYYDTYTQQFEPKYQLGLIPVLSYKVMF